MAKIIRFPLQMNGINVRTIEELRENFDIESVLGYFANGKLTTWLRNRYYDTEANAMEALEANDSDLNRRIIEILGVKYDVDSTHINIKSIQRRNEKLMYLKQSESDQKYIDNFELTAFNQDDLDDIISFSDVVYLWEGDYTVNIPLRKITLIGIHNTRVSLTSDTEDVNSLNIEFKNIHDIQTEHKQIIILLSQILIKNDIITDLASAEMWFKKALKYCDISDISDMGFQLGVEYFNNAQYIKALDFFKTVINIMPDEYIKRIIEIVPSDNVIRLKIAESYLAEFETIVDDDLIKADEYVEKIIKLVSPNNKMLTKISELYLAKSEIINSNETEDYINRIVKISEKDRNTMLLLGNYYLKKSDLKNAKLYYSRSETNEGKEKARELHSFLLCLSGASQGVSSAQSRLGDYYLKGEYVDKNVDEAIRLYTLAANGGNIYAQTKLDKLKLDGDKNEIKR